jgi:aspartate carbamoyltransferase
MLAAIAPDCTLNIVSDHRVKRKYRVRLPARVDKLPGVQCRNTDCISSPEFHEPVVAEFHRSAKGTFICRYCNTPHEYKDIWVD